MTSYMHLEYLAICKCSQTLEAIATYVPYKPGLLDYGIIHRLISGHNLALCLFYLTVHHTRQTLPLDYHPVIV